MASLRYMHERAQSELSEPTAFNAGQTTLKDCRRRIELFVDEKSELYKKLILAELTP